ncbi:MAG: sulfite exporter TauE/SafE family protein [Actinobacteria bacterium]|nr:sulfite exporter TauE/SafE family protein [Actinomycetota bacterium]
MEYIKFILIGISGGTLSGLLGIGGGFIVIPLLIYFTDTDTKAATAISMVSILFSSVFGTIFNFLKKTVKIKYALYFGIASMGFAFAGSMLTRYFSDTAIKIAYLCTIILSLALFILRMYFIKKGKADESHNIENPAFEKKKLFKSVPLGAAAGFLSGLLGVGGGFLYVPLLTFFLDLPLKTAVGTSLMVIIFNSVPGVIGKFLTIEFDYINALIVAVSAIAGSRLGTYINHKVKPVIIRIVFIFMLLVIIGRVAFDLAGF